MPKVRSNNIKNLILKKKLRKQQVSNMLLFSNMKSGLLKKFDNFKIDEQNKYAYGKAISKVSRFSKFYRTCFVKGVIFYGPTGVGKTHLLCAIANKLISEYLIFTYFLKTVNIPRENSDAIQELIEPNNLPVVCLDDIGTEKMTERALECLYIIIDGRLDIQEPLFATTNYNKEQLKIRLDESGNEYGSRIVSRLQELCEWVPVGGCDYRNKL